MTPDLPEQLRKDGVDMERFGTPKQYMHISPQLTEQEGSRNGPDKCHWGPIIACVFW